MDLRTALRLYLVADPDQCEGNLLEYVAAAIRGGVSMVQLRAKGMDDLEVYTLARAMREVCARHHVPFIVNDRVDIALAVAADGVHLGVHDLPLEQARTISRDRFIIGYSPETDEQTHTAAVRGADYLGIGPIYGTTTKPDAGTALGLQGFANRVRMSELPAVGIGGIGESNFRDVLSAGAAGIAVVSAILRAADAEGAANQLSRN